VRFLRPASVVCFFATAQRLPVPQPAEDCEIVLIITEKFAGFKETARNLDHTGAMHVAIPVSCGAGHPETDFAMLLFNTLASPWETR
jgi:hypothetical protein